MSQIVINTSQVPVNVFCQRHQILVSIIFHEDLLDRHFSALLILTQNWTLTSFVLRLVGRICGPDWNLTERRLTM